HVPHPHLHSFPTRRSSDLAVSGAFLTGFLVPQLLFVIFGIVLLISVIPLVFKIGEELPKGVRNDRLANWLHLYGSYPDRHLGREDRKSTRLNSSHRTISYA